MFKSQKKITRHTKKQGSVAQSKKWNKVPESETSTPHIATRAVSRALEPVVYFGKEGLSKVKSILESVARLVSRVHIEVLYV